MTSVNNLFQIAAIQMVSGASLEGNLSSAESLIADAARQGAKLVALPEYFCFMGHRDGDKLGIKETPGKGLIQDFLADNARKHGIWLIGGSLPLQSGETARIYNSSLVFGPDGVPVGRYDKIHLFNFRKGEEFYDESVSIKAGSPQAKVVELPFGKVGLSICYDLRFPELYRAMGEVDLIVVPSAFTYTTGSAHWEVLLRARAIENQCYVLAPAQGGQARERPAYLGTFHADRPLGRGPCMFAGRRGCSGRRVQSRSPGRSKAFPAGAQASYDVKYLKKPLKSPYTT